MVSNDVGSLGGGLILMGLKFMFRFAIIVFSILALLSYFYSINFDSIILIGIQYIIHYTIYIVLISILVIYFLYF